MYSDIIKNPIVLAVLAGVLTYLYLSWSNKDKKNKKRSQISLFTPIVVAVIVYLLSYAYFGGTQSTQSSTVSPIMLENQIPIGKQMIPTQTYHFARDSESPASFHLISKGVNIPNNISVPDVFIETY